MEVISSPNKTRKITKELKKLQFCNPGPQMRSATTDKRQRKPVQSASTTRLYDELGRLLPNLTDLCDCLQDKCPGCFLPCSKCQSNKCGHECRVNRTWSYQCLPATVLIAPSLNYQPHTHATAK